VCSLARGHGEVGAPIQVWKHRRQARGVSVSGSWPCPFRPTNNYRASGGGNFPGLDGSNIVLEASETNQEIIKDWLIEQRTVDAAVTPIWSFVPIAAPVQVVFESSPEARSLVGDGTRIRHVGEGQNGFGLYS
jgi:2',3'-cyclic-nucleotide 2'-phosphodiesterase/3'-nucleotidase